MKPKLPPSSAAGRRIVVLAALAVSLAGGLLVPVSAETNENTDYPHGEFREDCTLCHSEQGWYPAEISREFDHDLYGFALDGAHKRSMCRSCHLSLEFDDADPACITCHTDVHRGELGADCGLCHSTSNFIDRSDDIRSHRMSRFPLTGAHFAVDCESCHPLQPQGGLRFVGTPIECVSCHVVDYQSTTDPDHMALGFQRECRQCHSTVSWNQGSFLNFNHATTGFSLAGAHKALQCTDCHAAGKFTGNSSQCQSCHQQEFDNTTQPDHTAGGFPQECQQCHTSSAWTPADFDHALTGFPLTGSHVPLECAQCHTGGNFLAASAECLSCHQPDFQQAPGHVSGNFPQTCEDCHSTVGWGNATFNHDFFPFVGGHSGLDCQQCHTSGEFTTIPADCASCHQADYQQAPGHSASNFAQTCEDCHSLNTWVDATFDHGQYPLTGGHANAACADCHTSGVYAAIPPDCATCHAMDYQQAPGHATSGFPQTCEECHTITTWSNATFDHGVFALSGGHAAVECADCHTGGSFGTIPADCASCHQVDYQQAPGHAASNFAQTCEDCHTVTTWANTTFDHGAYPLSGAHSGISCTQCHTSGSYGTIPQDCASCHQTEYQQAPGHVGSFPQTCEDCHTATTWTNATFDHGVFPLTGSHSGVSCVQCHTSGVFGTIPADCASCHQSDFQQAPGHVASNFAQTCEDCHTTTTWTNPTFDHGFYPLAGGHTGLQCVNCHTSGVYAAVPMDCVSCHLSDYQQATGHATFPQTCEDCHTVTAWANATFDHGIFPLTGGHTGTQCAQCHTNGTYGTIPADCVFCHMGDYAQAPGHTASAFPQTCEDCHTITTWTNATFDHGIFPLTGGHNAPQCVDCHTTGVYGTIPSDCVSCHQSDYQQAPGHAGSFPQTCDDCHSVTTWANATFDHGVFALTGGHNGLQCVDCHTSGVYGTIPANCFSCHQSDYQQAPDHLALNFPHDCEDCHSTTVWSSTTFVHSFPLNGRHDEPCATCHNAGTTESFVCYGACHEHNPSQTNNDHSEVPGYSYDYQACYSCHPNGRS